MCFVSYWFLSTSDVIESGCAEGWTLRNMEEQEMSVSIRRQDSVTVVLALLIVGLVMSGVAV